MYRKSHKALVAHLLVRAIQCIRMTARIMHTFSPSALLQLSLLKFSNSFHILLLDIPHYCQYCNQYIVSHCTYFDFL
jgi:hypothetical protein